jgi:hypothetical protein
MSPLERVAIVALKAAMLRFERGGNLVGMNAPPIAIAGLILGDK